MKIEVITKNNKIRDYEVEHTLIAGLVLKGEEAKATSRGQFDLSGTVIHFVSIPNGVKPVLFGVNLNGKLGRGIDLLLKQREIDSLFLEQRAKKRLIPVALLKKGRYFKIEFAVCRHSKKQDMRQKELEKEHRKEINDE